MPFTGVKPLTEDPPGYDPEKKYEDPVLYYKHKEAMVAEEYVKIAEAKVRLCSVFFGFFVGMGETCVAVIRT